MYFSTFHKISQAGKSRYPCINCLKFHNTFISNIINFLVNKFVTETTKNKYVLTHKEDVYFIIILQLFYHVEYVIDPRRNSILLIRDDASERNRLFNYVSITLINRL